MNKNYKIDQLKNYYSTKGLSIIGLNDSQGVNISPTFFKKGLLEYIADTLTDKKINPIIINAFSLMMNKTRHIDYFLKNNLTVEEIKLSQIYSALSAFEKVMTDLKLPKSLGKIANGYRLVYRIKKGDEEIKITDVIRNTEEPTLIYSSGANDLMTQVWNNPFAIMRDYKNKDITPNYNYTLEKAKDPNSINNVICDIERNFERILYINGKTDIYTLGAYIPKSLQIEALTIFRELIEKYNESLEKLCKQYNITYINTEIIGKKYNKSEANFHISSKGHNDLANHILSKMYEKKFLSVNSNFVDHDKPSYKNELGVTGVLLDTEYAYSVLSDKEKEAIGYEKVVELGKLMENQREREVFEKVLEGSNAKLKY